MLPVCRANRHVSRLSKSLTTGTPRRVITKRDNESRYRPPPPDYLWGGIFDDLPAYGWLANPSGVECIFSAKNLPQSYFVPHQPRSYFSSHRQRYQQHRQYATQAPVTPSVRTEPPPPPESIFNTKASPWEHVFDDLGDHSPLSTIRSSPLRPNTVARRQAMTEREISAFDEMFNMIFEAASQKKKEIQTATGTGDDPLIGKGIGRQIGDLFGKLRRHSKKMKWSTDLDELLDRKKEAMNLCDTDQQLLEWAMTEVFDESKRYEEVARKAIAEALSSTSIFPTPDLPMLQPPTYPKVVALLMKSFREKYQDPHLALSIFDYARRLSVASYVFGCSTSAYNELIETRWACFRDLKGVYDALEEMAVNIVETDARTRKLIEHVRGDLVQGNMWEEENGESWAMLSHIEKLLAQSTVNRASRSSSSEPSEPRWDGWKTETEEVDDDYEFGGWEKDPNRRF